MAAPKFPSPFLSLSMTLTGPLDWDWYYANAHLYHSDVDSEHDSEISSSSAPQIFGPDGDHFRANCNQLRAKERLAGVSADVSDGSAGSHGLVGSDNGSEYSAY
ncbi:hypothetical protein BT96DRAFT_1008259 [Gymnopus androsaceus JB14]|uniref:Uncharacterized protein n=1 Tax=Gymnopus androsaceus JB14 TaxID=1447944 RepID=A0A6A4GFA3_9AGAR|nr:hypothetical protein BT96DRAFT_1008259 [Gymnopus androsaceus JB14]